MPTTSNQTPDNNGPAFRWDCGEDWMRFSADLNHLCRRISEQITATVSTIDFESIGREIRDAMQEAGEEFRRAMRDWSPEESEFRPDHVAVDERIGQAETTGAEATVDERLVVLRLVAEGKITAEEGARLLEALGA